MFRILFSSGSVFRVLFKIRPAASCSGFSVLLKNVQGIIQLWFSIHGIIQNTTCSVLFRIQRIIKKCPGYYSASGSLIRVLFKIRHAASGLGFSVLLKMSRVLFSVWFSFQGIIQNTTCSVWFRIQRIIKKNV